jgi:hypothetical protein
VRIDNGGWNAALLATQNPSAPAQAVATTSLGAVTASPLQIAGLSALTSNDKSFIAQVTGYRFTVDATDGKTYVEGHTDNPHGSIDDMAKARHLAEQIGSDRMNGALSGSISPSYLHGVLTKSLDGQDTYPSDWLQKGLNVLASRAADGDSTGNNLDRLI